MALTRRNERTSPLKPSKILANFPLFLIPLIAYNIIVFTAGSAGARSVLDSPLFEFRLVSGAVFSLDVSTLLIIISLHLIYFEILKSVRSSVSTIINHTLSLIIFIVFLVEFITVPQAGTTDFFVLMAMSLLVVIAGFTVSISSARRDFMVER
jgi:hypothetical protein